MPVWRSGDYLELLRVGYGLRRALRAAKLAKLKLLAEPLMFEQGTTVASSATEHNRGVRHLYCCIANAELRAPARSCIGLWGGRGAVVGVVVGSCRSGVAVVQVELCGGRFLFAMLGAVLAWISPFS